MKNKILKNIIVFAFLLIFVNVFSQNEPQQVQLTEQQLRDLIKNPEMMQQYGTNAEELKALAAQNGINLGNAEADINANPKQLKDLSGKSVNQLLRSGNDEYASAEFVEAEINYRKSLEKDPNRIEGIFNLGNSLYEQQRFDEAFEKFDEATAKIKDKKQKADAFHNLGNSYLNAKKLDEAIGAFKNALKMDPTNEDSRYNLAYANFLKKKKQKEDEKNKDCNNPEESEDGEKKEEKKEEKEEKEEKEKKEDKEKKDEEKKKEEEEKKDKEKQDKEDKDKDGEKEKSEEEKKKEEEEKKQEEDKKKEDQAKEDKEKEEKDEKPSEEKGEDQQKEQQEVAQGKMTKQEAERLLEALRNEEKKVQAKLLKNSRPQTKRSIEKDW